MRALRPLREAERMALDLARREELRRETLERLRIPPTDPPTDPPRSARSAAPAAPQPPQAPRIAPLAEGGQNTLRPRTLDEVVGQEKLKPLLRRLIQSAQLAGRSLNHMLFVGAGGTGKTTLASVVAHEVGTRVFALEAPLDTAILMELREVVRDSDVIFVDEIHKQVSGDRRGLTQACDPEQFYALLEDGVLATARGPVTFPKVTWIGATTDVGLLPISLSDRFTIQPRLQPYTEDELTVLAARNAGKLRLRCDDGVCAVFAGASRGVPRVVNNYMRAAQSLGSGFVTMALAEEVIVDLFSTTLDGLTDSMQTVLRYLYQYCAQPTSEGVVYRASVNNLATAAGHGRDTKAIQLLVEPFLLQRGLLQVRPTGRVLTPAGVERARQLTKEV